MAMTPEPLPVTEAVSFRAPPPSPVASGRRSPIANDDVLMEYLEQSLKVPDLILPDRVFPKQISAQNPPKIDLQNLNALENDSKREISELVAQTGCVEVVNHRIPRDLIRLVLFLAAGVFEISPEKKKKAERSPERKYGFEEVHGEDDIGDQSEEFLWGDDEGMRLEMEGIWPFGYSNFSQEMEKLYGEIEEIGTKILKFLQRNSKINFYGETNSINSQKVAGNFSYIQKHHRKIEGGRPENSLRYDVIRMLIRGSEFPHALCLHICSGSTDFHVYSKKGWLSFCPNEDSIVITIGDKLQVWSGGEYKHVIGRPIFKDDCEKCISMGFLFNPSNPKSRLKGAEAVTITLAHQIIFVVFITLLYQFSFYIYPLW